MKERKKTVHPRTSSIYSPRANSRVAEGWETGTQWGDIEPTQLSIACRASSRYRVEEHLANDAPGHTGQRGNYCRGSTSKN